MERPYAQQGRSEHGALRSNSRWLMYHSRRIFFDRSLQSVRKTSHLIKERKSRFYIFRRCVVMLLCWHD
ncbi:hypothetical protein O6H91_07G114000 [Diphasiastrum complanatum]|uniref:Uncharacterized protein n=1 Tax=Diphasiastrum complanatum TaxID=34168 RepID=A0ACC2D9D4_DIPCM|nr:hypothetical protein O6H91_07G114000 [Diphasiastrum complanatum]